MSDDQLAQIDRVLSRLNSAADLLKFGAWIVGGMVSAIVAVAGWVYHVNTLQAQNAANIAQLAAERKINLDEWRGWRSKKDEVDVRLTAAVETLSENQKRVLRLLESHLLSSPPAAQ